LPGCPSEVYLLRHYKAATKLFLIRAEIPDFERPKDPNLTVNNGDHTIAANCPAARKTQANRHSVDELLLSSFAIPTNAKRDRGKSVDPCITVNQNHIGVRIDIA
jgi:hypothetical protein